MEKETEKRKSRSSRPTKENSARLFVSYEQFPHRARKKFKCELCKTDLSCKEALRKHILTTHIKLKPHTCDACNQSFIFEKSLTLHKETHSDVPLYKCDCGKVFAKKSSFQYHTRHHHLHRSSTPLRCSFCQSCFTGRKHLRYHVQVQHMPKTLKCTFTSCQRIFPTRTLLRQHLRTHSEVRHACLVCKNTFKSKAYMEKHKACHEGAASWLCPACDRRFASASHVAAHRRRAHAPSEAFLCALCGKTFKHKHDMMRHERAHTRT